MDDEGLHARNICLLMSRMKHYGQLKFTSHKIKTIDLILFIYCKFGFYLYSFTHDSIVFPMKLPYRLLLDFPLILLQ